MWATVTARRRCQGHEGHARVRDGYGAPGPGLPLPAVAAGRPGEQRGFKFRLIAAGMNSGVTVQTRMVLMASSESWSRPASPGLPRPS
jgi:hypothetical protein